MADWNLRKTTIALVTGNGFDRDLGLPSSFSQFAESKEWRNLLMAYGITGDNGQEQDLSLLWHLNNAIKPNWFDIEEEIHQFVKSHHNISDEQAYRIQKEFDALNRAFYNYLQRVTTDFKAANTSLAYQFLMNLPKCPVYITDYSFNYTIPDSFVGELQESPVPFHITREHIHGSLKDNDIIIGCDPEKNEEVNRLLSFTYKYNKLKHANFINLSLDEAREVIFFGHSINGMDFCYFREFFKKASYSYNSQKDVTIITWDENSERNIKDNIRSQGISVTDLYNSLTSFTFIHSSKIYNGDKVETEKWKDFLFRITEKAKAEYNNKNLLVQKQ